MFISLSLSVVSPGNSCLRQILSPLQSPPRHRQWPLEKKQRGRKPLKKRALLWLTSSRSVPQSALPQEHSQALRVCAQWNRSPWRCVCRALSCQRVQWLRLQQWKKRCWTCVLFPPRRRILNLWSKVMHTYIHGFWITHVHNYYTALFCRLLETIKKRKKTFRFMLRCQSIPLK